MTDPDEVKLLPCDWCGKVPSIVCPDNSYGSAFITCGDANECPVDVTAWAALPHETLEDAKRRWNTRTRPPVVTDEVVERVARAIALSDYSSENIVWPGDFSPQERIDYYDNARAAIASMPAVVSGGPGVGTFNLGDLVQKKGRASWRGKVVGSYQTELTELGYAVESSFEPGSVQIYPSTALLPWDGAAQSEIGE